MHATTQESAPFGKNKSRKKEENVPKQGKYTYTHAYSNAAAYVYNMYSITVYCIVYCFLFEKC
jgi:hypothetical protein